MNENDSCKKILINKAAYQQLINYITESLEKDEDGNVLRIETTVRDGTTDAFYEANGRYSIFNTCNSWANLGLKVSGQKACLWTAFQQGIFLKH